MIAFGYFVQTGIDGGSLHDDHDDMKSDEDATSGFEENPISTL